MPARRVRRLACELAQTPVADVFHQGRLARAAHAGDADETAERNADVDVLEVVLRRSEHFQASAVPERGAGRRASGDPLLFAQVLRGERRAALKERGGGAEEHHLAAALSRPWSDVEHPIRREHDLRVMLHHEEGIAGVAQPVQHADHAAHVARVEPDAWLVEHEERVDERGAERGGEVDALHLAPAQGARLPVQGQVAESDLHEVAQASADLVDQQGGGIVHRRRQTDRLEEAGAGRDRHQHHVVDREPGQRAQARLVERAADGPEAGRGAKRPLGVRDVAHPPVQRGRLQACSAAFRTRRVGAVFREQHPDVHLVALGLEPVEEAAHPVPRSRSPAPGAFALDHPAAMPRRQASPGAVHRHFPLGARSAAGRAGRSGSSCSATPSPRPRPGSGEGRG